MAPGAFSREIRGGEKTYDHRKRLVANDQYQEEEKRKREGGSCNSSAASLILQLDDFTAVKTLYVKP